MESAKRRRPNLPAPPGPDRPLRQVGLGAQESDQPLDGAERLRADVVFHPLHIVSGDPFVHTEGSEEIGQDLVAPGDYRAWELGYTATQSVRRFYIEGMGAGASNAVTFSFSPDGGSWSASDRAVVSVIRVDTIQFRVGTGAT